MSKFNKTCHIVVEGLNVSEMGAVEFTWKNVDDTNHKNSLLKIIKNDPCLFNRTIYDILYKAQNISRTLDNPYQRLLKSSRTCASKREVIEDGNKIVLKIHGVPVDPKANKISEEFMKSLSYDIQYALEELVNWNARSYPDGFPECWKFTSNLITRFTKLTDRLPELKGMFESVNDVVDVVVELRQNCVWDDTDEDAPSLKNLADLLRIQTCLHYEDTWATKYRPLYEWEIKKNPLRIIFKDIEKDISKWYVDAMSDVMSMHAGQTDRVRRIHIDAESAIARAKIKKIENRLPELKGMFEDTRAHGDSTVLFQNVYVTFDKIKDESLLNEFEKCLTELKTVLENKEGVGRANLANCECKIQKNKNEFTFVVKKVPFTEIEVDPKQKHHAENNLNHKFWECLWFILSNRNSNNSKRDWLRAHLSVNKYEWKHSGLDAIENRLPELKGMFD